MTIDKKMPMIYECGICQSKLKEMKTYPQKEEVLVCDTCKEVFCKEKESFRVTSK